MASYFDESFTAILDNWKDANESEVHNVKLHLVDPAMRDLPVAIQPKGETGWILNVLQIRDSRASVIMNRIIPRDGTQRIKTARISPILGKRLDAEKHDEISPYLR